jgi:hypothetical protein
MLIFLYLPVLMSIPVLWLVGILFVFVPGGFILVLVGGCLIALAAVYYIAGALIGLVGLAAKRGQPATDATWSRPTAVARPAKPIAVNTTGAAALTPSACSLPTFSTLTRFSTWAERR